MHERNWFQKACLLVAAWRHFCLDRLGNMYCKSECRTESRYSCCAGICSYREVKSGCIDAKDAHQLRSQGHHNDEVDGNRELYRGQH